MLPVQWWLPERLQQQGTAGVANSPHTFLDAAPHVLAPMRNAWLSLAPAVLAIV